LRHGEKNKQLDAILLHLQCMFCPLSVHVECCVAVLVRKICWCLCTFASVCVCVVVYVDYDVGSALFCGLNALAVNAIMLIIKNAQIPGARLPATLFFTAVSNIFGSAIWKCLRVSHLLLRSLRLLLNLDNLWAPAYCMSLH